MPEASTLALFATAALVLLVTPGPAVLYIIATSLQGGRVAGLFATLGLSVGGMVHVTAAALGLSALLASSVVAFNLVKYAGAAYLIYLGVRTLLARPAATPAAAEPRPSVPARHHLYQGFLVNLLNPKAALFIFALLPQFVDPARGSATAQIFVLGGVLVGLGLLCDGLYALLAGSLGHWLQRRPRFAQAQQYATGGVYLALGVLTALTGARK